MSGKLELSGAQGRKRKSKEEEEAKKLRKTMAAFITVNRRNDQSGNDDEPNQPIMSTTAAAEENDVRDSDFTHSSENESEEEQTVNKAAASSVEDDRPEQAAVVTAATEEDDPVLIYKDVGYINFSATGQASIGQLLKEAMVRQGYDCFQNADANFAKEEFGSKATVRDKKGAAGYEEIILKKLKDDDLKFSDCHAQITVSDVAAEWGIPTERRIRRKKKMDGEKATGAGLTLVEEIDRVMKLSLDRLVQEIRDRSKLLQDLNSKFGFLLDVQSLIASEDVNEDSLLPHCVDFAIAYEGDVDASSLLLEIMDCRMLMKKRPNSEVPSTPEELLKFTIHSQSVAEPAKVYKHSLEVVEDDHTEQRGSGESRELVDAPEVIE
eukprot:Em0020g590a